MTNSNRNTNRTTMTTSRRVALYVRVSTNKQTVESQTLALEAHAARAGWTIVETYRDNGVSGTKDRRPGLDRMLSDARHGKFEMIAIFALDRLGRSTIHLMKIAEQLEALGIDLYSHTQAIDTGTPSGKLFFTILAAIGSFEREMLVDRVNAGLDRARAKGTRLGRPVGWRIDKRKNTDEVLTLAENGLSSRKIAAVLSMSRTTVLRIIRERA